MARVQGLVLPEDDNGAPAKEKEFQARLRFVNENGWRVEGRGANRFRTVGLSSNSAT